MTCRVLLAFASLVLLQCDCDAFLPIHNNRAFVAPQYMTPPTRPLDEWELPDEVPRDRSLSSSASASSRMSETRRLRLEREARIKQKYVTGDDLYHLRQHALSLREDLLQARRLGATFRIHEIEQAILKVQQVDAEFLYAVNLERSLAAKAEGRTEDAERFHQLAMDARSALPQYNLDGLWVGKYGDDCYEMINVTYVGDTLVATKVTGHSPVPSGEISFHADLSPLTTRKEPLEPIQLGKEAAEQWGAQYLSRFKGKGQVASKGFVNSHFVEGQLIMVNEYFSFAWIPLNHQVFFGRPSPSLTLKMLHDVKDEESEISSAYQHLNRCMEETVILEQEMKQEEDGVAYSSNQQDYYNQDGCWE